MSSESKNLIEQRARELGFDACRFTTAAAPESARHFHDWLVGGCHGEMGYLQRNASKRVNPQEVLPGARSIIVLTASYHTPLSPQNVCKRGETAGLVAQYARFDDYHAVLGERLKQLAESIAELGVPETRSLWYVDTGPFLERDLAQRAGAGFIGKHTNLVSRGLGNWLFLCEIITTLDLPPDDAEKNRCGRCVRCIQACPTQAITAPFQLDARRCISYLTIELKGSIPVEFRSAIGNRIYGCDDCLAVCPWNRFAKEGGLMKSHARPDLAKPDLVELLSLNDDDFKRLFAGTPMLRTKRRGLLRNVCVALGNTADERALPALGRAAADSEPLVVEHARWAIEEIRRREKSAPENASAGDATPEPERAEA